MNRVLTFILLISSLTTFGQDTASTRSKFFLGVSFSPDYCYRTQVNKNIPDSTWNAVKDFSDSIETSKFGYTAGINFGYYINEKFSIETGILYSRKGYKTIPINTLTYDNSGNINSIDAIFISTYHYLDFPFKVNYTFLKKRIKIVVGVGVTVNDHLNSTYTTDPPVNFDYVFVTSLSYANKINLSPTISIGAQYQLNEKMNLRIEPSYHYALFSVDDNSHKSIHLWNAGINFSYYYKL